MGAKQPFDYDLDIEKKWKAAEKGDFASSLQDSDDKDKNETADDTKIP
jgi:hypothetical protein